MSGVIAALAVPTVLGYLIVSVLLRNEAKTGVLERLCLAYPIGAGIVTVQMFLLGLMRIPLTLWFSAAPPLLEIAGLSFLVGKRRIPLARKPSFDLVSEILGSSSRLKKAVLVMLFALAAAKVGSIFIETYLRPIFAWDSFANWSASAKAFFYSHGLLLDGRPGDFFGRGLLNRNANYPPFNPLMQVWMSLWVGKFDEVLVKFWSPLYLLSMAVYLYLFMARETSRVVALGMLVLFLSSPLLSVHSIEVYSDVPLSAYILFSLIMFLRAMRGEHAYWALMGFFAGEALFIKDEAPFFVIPLLAAAFLFYRQGRRRKTIEAKLPAGSLLGLLLPVPWFVFKFSQGLGFGADYVTVAFTFRPEMIVKAIGMMLSLHDFNVFLPFFVLLLILSRRPHREFSFLLFPVACYAVFFMLLYSLTQFFSGSLMFNTAVFRNTLTYYPAICFLTFLLIRDLISEVARPGNP
jgi:4-amino-4-deoxy-L-arabinose transferase-like glycosyltransferase